jgi:hypothetical protein
MTRNLRGRPRTATHYLYEVRTRVTFNESGSEVLNGVPRAAGYLGVAPVAYVEVGTGCKHRPGTLLYFHNISDDDSTGLSHVTRNPCASMQRLCSAL